MGETTGIAWTDATFNPWIGCTKVSPACDHCYAEAGSKRLAAQHGLKLWEGDRFMTSPEYWKHPHRWNRAAEKEGRRRRVFCASFADVFESRIDLIPKRVALFKLIEDTPWLDWLLLTKRPENMRAMAPIRWAERWPANVWAGTTCENQERAELRVPILATVPARVRFISYEPAIGPVDFTRLRARRHGAKWNVLGSLDWIIVGGESGARDKVRPFDLGWAYATRDQCEANGVAFFMKQMGTRPVTKGCVTPTSGIDPVHFKAKKGEDPVEWPERLRMQAFPIPRASW